MYDLRELVKPLLFPKIFMPPGCGTTMCLSSHWLLEDIYNTAVGHAMYMQILCFWGSGNTRMILEYVKTIL